MPLSDCPECSRPISTGAKTCPHCGYKIKRGYRIWKLIGKLILSGIILFCSLVVLGALVDSSNPRPSPTTTKTHFVEVTKSSWSRDDYGKARHAISLKNTVSYRVQDIVVRITYTSKTGTMLASHDHTVYEFLDPEKTIKVTVEDYAPKDAERAGVTVVSGTQS